MPSSVDLPARPATLSRQLGVWFEAHARDLPWRTERTPYRVWLSEVMLQQTRVATVIDYFERFTARFSDVEQLAAASEDDVLALWSGLGYYSRGRNLHRAARLVTDELGGEFPGSAEGLRALPGVGPYTAAAIASLAFGERDAVLDGNVARVLSRLCDDATPVDSPEGKRDNGARAQSLVDAASDPGALNEALMELGALVCTPRSPGCERCPWRRSCRARAADTVSELPRKSPRRARKAMRVACVVVHDGDWVWLEKRERSGLFGGLYEPPGSELGPRASAAKAARGLLEERGLEVPVRLPRARRVERTLTHRDLRFDVVSVAATRPRRGGAAWFRGSGLSEIGLSSAVRAVLEAGWPEARRFLGDHGRRA
jgi:A/G-specific adenine glycosylase